MKRHTLTSLILAGMILFCGCAGKSAPGSSTSSSSPAESSSSTEAAVTTPEATVTAAPQYDYVHGTEGYYNLAEELKYFKMYKQYSGTCWLYAASASMSSAYERETGKEFNVKVSDMLELIYGDEKQEGVFIKNGFDKSALGGYQGFVTDRLSGGYSDGITLVSSMVIDPADREAVKNAVKTRGGVAAIICDKNVEQKWFGSYFTVNYKQAEVYDHYVTIIGWDDHFPKEYFKVPATEDGAWIVYNSNINGGYYYISYCSPFDHTISHTVSDKYSEVLSYDAGNKLAAYVKTGDSTKVANVFHKEGKLSAVGTFNDFDYQDIKIEIMSADFGKVLYTQEATLDYQGYHTIQLSTPVEVNDFAVVITYTKGAPVEGESIDTVVGSYKTSIEKGQSFVFAGGKWKDMSDEDINTVLTTGKGRSVYFSENGMWKDFLNESEAEMLFTADFAPGNCCIKALFQE